MNLWIRASRNDHAVVERLCAPASAGLWQAQRLPMQGLVADANVAAEREQLREVAAAAGIPFAVDPLTPLFQDVQAPDHAWASLPFASPERHTPANFGHAEVQDELIERVINFQRNAGATVLIPPYFYAGKRGDGWMTLNIQLLARTKHYLESHGIDLPVAPVFAASLLEYGPQSAWHEGIDAFVRTTHDMNVQFVALSWSVSSPGSEGYSKLAHLLSATRHASAQHPVLAWRQGLYGLALSAVGATGYETGAGQAERCHYPEFAANRRPVADDAEKDGSGPRGNAFVYFSAFGRSVPRRVGAALLANPQLRGSLVCSDDLTCCRDGANSMVGKWREHAIRARARELRDLAQMPSKIAWRLNSVARDAERSVATVRLANDVLAEAGERQRLPEDTFRGLVQVADELRSQVAEEVA